MKYKKSFLTIIILQSIVCFCFSQNRLSLEVLDAKTLKPVPFCEVIYGKNLGTVTNNDGTITISFETLPDFITVYNLAYETQYVKISETPNSYKIFLEPKVYEIPEVNVLPKQEQLLKIGFFKKDNKGSMSTTRRGYHWALFIANDRQVNGTIKNVQFYMRKLYENPTAAFRVHIYEIDTITQGPGQELLPENIFAKAKKGNEWVIVDVAKYQIKFPKEGFFIGCEMLYNMEDEPRKEKDDIRIAVIGISNEAPKQYLSWMKPDTNSSWSKLILDANFKTNYINFKMGCEIILE
jgi:hypothetical protein